MEDTQNDIIPAPAAEETSTNGPVVEITGLSKSFGEHQVLKNISLKVARAENLVVLGKSGSGKSTLIKCMVGLETPDDGEIRIFGKRLVSRSYRQLNEMRLRIGFLFQSGALYDSMTVRENLAFPLKQHNRKLPYEERDQRIMEMLDNVGLPDVIDQMPSELSGGQAKRIGLARTLILRPELMLYDEPTTGLDTVTSHDISDLINRMQRKYKISSITITHDMTCAKLTADRIIILKDGEISAEGTYEDLEKSNDEWVKSFFT